MSSTKDHSELQRLASLSRLRGTPDFNKFMEYIDGLLKEQIQWCINSDTPARAQGAANVLQQIQEDVDGAEEAFYRLSNQGEIPLA